MFVVAIIMRLHCLVFCAYILSWCFVLHCSRFAVIVPKQNMTRKTQIVNKINRIQITQTNAQQQKR